MIQTILQSFPAPTSAVLTGILAVFFLLECLLGYKLMRLWIALAGFLIGFALGAGISGTLIPTGDYAVLLVLLIGCVTGLITALAANKLYRGGVFIMVLWSVFLAISGAFAGNLKWVGILLGIGFGILAAMLALRFMRPWIILSTAVSGGFCASQLFLSLFKVDQLPAMLGLGLLFTILGLVIQARTTSVKKYHPTGKSGRTN